MTINTGQATKHKRSIPTLILKPNERYPSVVRNSLRGKINNVPIKLNSRFNRMGSTESTKSTESGYASGEDVVKAKVQVGKSEIPKLIRGRVESQEAKLRRENRISAQTSKSKIPKPTVEVLDLLVKRMERFKIKTKNSFPNQKIFVNKSDYEFVIDKKMEAIKLAYDAVEKSSSEDLPGAQADAKKAKWLHQRAEFHIPAWRQV